MIAVAVAPSSKATAQDGKRPRVIFFDTFPIADKLRPDDEVVVVEMRADEVVTDETLSGFKALQAAARRRTAVVATIDVSDVRGELAMNGAWVHTVFRGTVAQVHRVGSVAGRRRRVERGERIEFHISGGEATIRHVLVRADQTVPFPTARQYVVFLSEMETEHGWSLVDTVPLLIEGDKLVAVAPATSPMSGVTLSDLRRAVRR